MLKVKVYFKGIIKAFKMNTIVLIACLLNLPAEAQGPMAVVDATPIVQEVSTTVTPANDDEPQEVSIPRKLIRKFRRDAARLALRIEARKEDLRYQNIVIPRDNIESIYSVLTNIYSKHQTARSIAECNVHTFPNPSIDHLVIIFNRDVDWAAPLRAGISETTSPAINDLLDDYDLVIEKHVQWNDHQDALTIRSREPLNMAALANEFYNVEGIDEIDLGIPKIGGNDINIKRVHQGWEVEYKLRFGSYINGQGKTHIWVYAAKDDGTVEFISEGGDPIPDWMRCRFEAENIVTRI